jgi:hypothetical protein
MINASVEPLSQACPVRIWLRANEDDAFKKIRLGSCKQDTLSSSANSLIRITILFRTIFTTLIRKITTQG